MALETFPVTGYELTEAGHDLRLVRMTDGVAAEQVEKRLAMHLRSR
jgi:hypothetical protein